MIKNNQKITKEFCKGKSLSFRPKTVEEATLIQDALLRMGFSWWPGSCKDLVRCVKEGMTLDKKGELSVGASADSVLCSVYQLDENYQPPPTEHELLMEQFNKLSTRLDAIEKTQAEILSKFGPLQVNKPRPKAE